MEPIKDTDNQFTEEIRNHLFEEKNKPFSGMDLIALNIQRAREHGIPGYNFYRSVCGLKKASSFKSLNSEIKEKAVNEMSKVYRHPDDIDLFTGIMLDGISDQAFRIFNINQTKFGIIWKDKIFLLIN